MQTCGSDMKTGCPARRGNEPAGVHGNGGVHEYVNTPFFHERRIACWRRIRTRAGRANGNADTIEVALDALCKLKSGQ